MEIFRVCNLFKERKETEHNRLTFGHTHMNQKKIYPIKDPNFQSLDEFLVDEGACFQHVDDSVCGGGSRSAGGCKSCRLLLHLRIGKLD